MERSTCHRMTEPRSRRCCRGPRRVRLLRWPRPPDSRDFPAVEPIAPGLATDSFGRIRTAVTRWVSRQTSQAPLPFLARSIAAAVVRTLLGVDQIPPAGRLSIHRFLESLPVQAATTMPLFV